MDPFREFLGNICKRPIMYVGSKDFLLVSIYLQGYGEAMWDLRPDLHGTGLGGFSEWMAVRLDSCVRSLWSQIIFREDTGPDKFEALLLFYDEFARDRGVRGLDAILDDYERLKRDVIFGARRDRTCWCELPLAEWDRWRPA